MRKSKFIYTKAIIAFILSLLLVTTGLIIGTSANMNMSDGVVSDDGIPNKDASDGVVSDHYDESRGLMKDAESMVDDMVGGSRDGSGLMGNDSMGNGDNSGMTRSGDNGAADNTDGADMSESESGSMIGIIIAIIIVVIAIIVIFMLVPKKRDK